MAKLTKTDVEHVAKLAKLELTKDEIEKFLPQLSPVVEYISQLSQVDTSDTEPTSQTTGLENVFRGDVAMGGESLDQNDALSGTDKVHNGYFEVPAILEGRTDK